MSSPPPLPSLLLVARASLDPRPLLAAAERAGCRASVRPALGEPSEPPALVFLDLGVADVAAVAAFAGTAGASLVCLGSPSEAPGLEPAAFLRVPLEEGEVAAVLRAQLELRALRGTVERLRNAQWVQGMGRLASAAAHDFNNLLGIILSVSSLLHEDAPDEGPLREDLDEIRKAAERASHLSRLVLAFARRRPSGRGPAALGDRLEHLRELFTSTLGSRITVDLHRPTGEVLVDMDPVRFDHAVLNLALNARDAMPRGGKLDLGLDVVDGRARVQVRDGGEGMDEAVRARALEPFFTTRTSADGLGLPAAKAIVEAAGGALALESAPGRGTVVTLTLPLCVA